MFYYGWLRDDFSIIFGQFISFYIYIVNLHFKGIWLRVPFIIRLLLYATPVMAAHRDSTQRASIHSEFPAKRQDTDVAHHIRNYRTIHLCLPLYLSV
jgi:hypothetical protein